MAGGAVEIIIRADTRTAIYMMQQLGTEAQTTARRVSGASDEETAAMGRVTTSAHHTRNAVRTLAGAVGFLGLGLAMKDVIEGGMKLQESQTQLQSALKVTGQQAGRNFQQLNQYAGSLAEQGGFARAENLQALTDYVRETHSAAKATQMLSLATNIARGTGKGLNQTEMLISRAYTGQVGRLQRLIGPMVASKENAFKLSQAHKELIASLSEEYKGMGKAGAAMLKQAEIAHGITPQMAAVATLADKHATAVQFMAAATKVFGGATAAYAKTSAGQLTILRNTVQELVANIGLALLPTVKTVLGVFETLAKWLSKNTFVMKALGLTIAIVSGILAYNWVKTKLLAAADIVLSGAEGMLGIAYAEGATASIASRVALIANTAATAIATTANEIFVSSIIAVTVAADTLGISVALLTGGLILIVAAIIAAAYFLVTNLGTIWKAIKTGFEFVVKIIGDVISWIADHWKLLLIIFTGPIGAIVVFIVDHITQIKNVVVGIIHFFVGIADMLINAIEYPFKKAFAFLKWLYDHTIGPIIKGIEWVAQHLLGQAGPESTSALRRRDPLASRAQIARAARLHARPGRQYGGLVPGSMLAPTTTGTDSVWMNLTPGEGVLSTAAMGMIGGGPGLNALNAGHIPPALMGAMGGMQNIQIQPSPVYIKLDSRTIATAVLNYTLRRAARGPSSLTGGVLATGVAGLGDFAVSGQA